MNFFDNGYMLGIYGITRPSNENKENEGTCIVNIFTKANSIHYKNCKLISSVTDHYPLFMILGKTRKQKENNTKVSVNYNKLHS